MIWTLLWVVLGLITLFFLLSFLGIWKLKIEERWAGGIDNDLEQDIEDFRLYQERQKAQREIDAARIQNISSHK